MGKGTSNDSGTELTFKRQNNRDSSPLNYKKKKNMQGRGHIYFVYPCMAIMWVEFVVGFLLAPRCYSLGSLVFPSP